MGDMAVLHEKIIGTDDRLLSNPGRAMDGDMFAEDVVIANAQSGRFIAVLQILGGFTDDTAGKETISRSNRCSSGYIHMRADDTLSSNFNPFIDDCIRADLNAGVNLCFGMNDRRRMNHEKK